MLPVPPPDDLDAVAQSRWLALQQELRDLGVWRDADVDALGRYTRADQNARQLRDAIGAEFIVEGSKGQPRPNPLIGLYQQAEKQAREYARDLLLTPAARVAAKLEAEKSGDSELDDLLS